MSTAADTLAAHKVDFSYASRRVLNQVSLGVEAGEVVALLGRNGAGKSTLLRILLGFLRPQRGEVVLAGQALHRYGRRTLATRLAYVPQAHATPFPYSVREIVLMGRFPAHPAWRASHRPADIAAVDAMLERFGIAHLAGRAYTEISGGERQLVLLARALIQGARTLVMDEPFNGLDYGRQIQLLAHLRQLADAGHAILLTTHQPDHALLCASRVAVLMDGRISADGPAAQVVSAQTIRELYGVEVAAFSSPQGHVAFYPVHSLARPISIDLS